jgi:signal transduction histidine kinase
VFFGCAFAQVFNGGFASPYVAGITVCPLLATFIGGVRMGLGWAGAAVALQLGIYVALHAGAELPRAIGDPDFDRSAAIAQALILGVITALAVSSELSKQAAMSRAEELGRSLERARTEVTSARIESEAAVSMSAVRSRFLATMSHELRTPLNAILGYAELAREEVRDSGALVSHQELDQILTAGQHLLALLNDILETSAIEASRIELRPAPCRLADVVDGVEAILGPLARRQGLRLIVTVDDPGGEVWLDPVRLRQILLNLGSNAIKFTSQGEVYVAASRRPVGGLSEIDLVVRDTGIGIAPADQERIFDAFVQVDASRARRYDGAGLGRRRA